MCARALVASLHHSGGICLAQKIASATENLESPPRPSSLVDHGSPYSRHFGALSSRSFSGQPTAVFGIPSFRRAKFSRNSDSSRPEFNIDPAQRICCSAEVPCAIVSSRARRCRAPQEDCVTVSPSSRSSIHSGRRAWWVAESTLRNPGMEETSKPTS